MELELVRHGERLFGQRTACSDQQSNSLSLESARSPADERTTAGAETGKIAPLRMSLTPNQRHRLWNHVASVPNFWESLEEVEPGAVARLASVAAAYRWEVMFLTKRSDSVGPSAQLQTQRWLEAHGYTLPSVFVVQGSRGRVAAALSLDFVVDDRPENCVDVLVDSEARPILVWREDQQALPAHARRLGIGVVDSTTNCIGILAEIDTALRERSSGAFNCGIRLLGLTKNSRARNWLPNRSVNTFAAWAQLFQPSRRPESSSTT